MGRYKNFTAAIYCPVGNLIDIKDFDSFEKQFEWIEKHVKIGKVYLETYRHGVLIEREHMEKVKQFFINRGIAVSGGITTDAPPDGEGGFDPLCYTSPETEKLMAKVSAFTASLFDEVILDDFYFTNCKCPSCIEKKGEQSWADFRVALMREFSKNVILKEAKQANPKVKMIIKFPNWYEHFQDSGYNLADEPGIFDAIYTGTETRNPTYTQQHLPKYLSYFNMRYMESIAPGRNGGGWFDPYECTYNLTSYAEQAQLTLLAKAREAMMFCLGSLLEAEYSLCAPVAGQVFEDMDAYLDELGSPIGTPAYIPFHSHGEDFIHNYIGMIGIPLEPTPVYPENAKQLFLAQSAAMDGDILEKIKKSLMNGADVIVTSGFVKETLGKGFEHIVNVGIGGKKAVVNKYAYSCDGGVTFGGCAESAAQIMVPQLSFQTNDTWELIAGLGEDNNFPILLKNLYGKGRVYILTIPEDCGNLYNYPRTILNIIRQIFSPDFSVQLDAFAKLGFFAYDNDCFVLHSFQHYYDDITFSVPGENSVVEDIVNGNRLIGQNIDGKTRFSLRMQPGINRVFRIRKRGSSL